MLAIIRACNVFPTKLVNYTNLNNFYREIFVVWCPVRATFTLLTMFADLQSGASCE